jgi:hypothetical protein
MAGRELKKRLRPEPAAQILLDGGIIPRIAAIKGGAVAGIGRIVVNRTLAVFERGD